MAVNQKNVSSIRGFASDPVVQYAGTPGSMPGRPSFLAAVLCRIWKIDDGVMQALFVNINIPGNVGFGITVRGNIAGFGAGHIVAEPLVGTGAAIIAPDIDLGPGPTGKLSLMHLAVSDTDDLRFYFNGGLVHRETLPAPAVGSALAPRVGGASAAGANPAGTTDIIGVAYAEPGAIPFSDDALDVIVVDHFNACHRAMAMAQLNELIAPADTGFTQWTNRFDVRNGAVVAGGQGTLNAFGSAASAPRAAEIWTPSEGAATLARVGPDPLPFIFPITNPVWAYTPANMAPEPP